jgi:hypothetical protein
VKHPVAVKSYKFGEVGRVLGVSKAHIKEMFWVVQRDGNENKKIKKIKTKLNMEKMLNVFGWH